MIDKETIQEYEKLINLIENDWYKTNPLCSSLSDLIDDPLICELARLTGHVRTYFIKSEPNGVRLDINQIKRLCDKISEEIEEWRLNHG